MPAPQTTNPAFRPTLNSSQTGSNVGTVGTASGLYVNEYGNEFHHQTVISFANTPITVANTTGASFGSLLLYTFPQGRLWIGGGTLKLPSIVWTGTTIVADGSGDISLGTTATSDATLNSTDVDLMASTALLDPFVLGVGSIVAPPAPGVLVKDTEFDGTVTAKKVYLNAIIDDADVEDAGSAIVLLSGELRFTWVFNGGG